MRMVTAMAKRPVAVDGALASALEAATTTREMGTAMRSPALDLATMTTLSRDMGMAVAVEPPPRRRDMATEAPHHPRGMHLAPIRTGVVVGMVHHRALTVAALPLMAARRMEVPPHMGAPHRHPTDRRMGHPTAPLVIPILHRIIHLDPVDLHRP